MSSRDIHDVVIVGSRCAGAATALLLARAGASVRIIERARPGTDTLSTHALMRPAVLQLERWGLLGEVRAAGTPAISKVTFRYGADSVTVDLQAKGRPDVLYAPRRTVLDRILADAAGRAGAPVEYGTRVVDVLRDRSARVTGVLTERGRGSVETVRGRLIIGADGASSTIAAATGAGSYREGAHSAAVIYGYWPGVPLTGYEWVFGEGTSAGAIPTNDELACVFVSMPAGRFLTAWPRDLRALHRQMLTSLAPDLAVAVDAPAQLHGFAGRPSFVRQSYGPGWALVGDAGCYRDPITAHGITDALRDAELLASAVLRDTDTALADYQSARDELGGRIFAISDEIASYKWSRERLRVLHDQLSQEMKREAYTVAAWTSPGSCRLTGGASVEQSTRLSPISIRTSVALPGPN